MLHILDVFGKTRKISLRLLDIEASASVIQGVKLEIEDSNYDLVTEVISTTDVSIACKDVDIAILLGGFPRLPGMERKDLISKNAEGMRNQARALNMYANRDCKVLVVANPANTNTLVAIKSAPDIPAANFSCLTRLDEERLRGFVSAKVNETLGRTGAFAIRPSAVTELCIFGNHSSTQVPYLDVAQVIVDGESKSLKPFISDVDSLVSTTNQSYILLLLLLLSNYHCLQSITDESSTEPGRRNHVVAESQQCDELRGGHREAPAGLARCGRHCLSCITCRWSRCGWSVLPRHPQ